VITRIQTATLKTRTETTYLKTKTKTKTVACKTSTKITKMVLGQKGVLRLNIAAVCNLVSIKDHSLKTKTNYY